MTYYNIWAWKDGENPQRPDYHLHKRTRQQALNWGRIVAGKYPLVEVEQVEASDYDLNDIQATSLVRSWKDGKQLTK